MKHLAGIGIGPFNLSLAALLARHPHIDAVFFERAEEFDWHPGLAFSHAEMQTSFLKDLVTTVDPTSPYTFLNFLAKQKRLYQFINADFSRIRRAEFAQYLRWVAESLPNLRFGRAVERVSFAGDHFVLTTAHSVTHAQSIVIGTGRAPAIPALARPHLGDSVFPAYEFQRRTIDYGGRVVAVVGGGQTGAEIVYELLCRPDRPGRIYWITRRSNLLPLDETPFTNEFFSPDYSDYFFRVCTRVRATLLQDQTLASDGISPALLTRLYQRFYELEFIEKTNKSWCVLPGQEVVDLRRTQQGWRLHLRSRNLDRSVAIDADFVLLATGLEYELPHCIEPLAGRIKRPDGRLSVKEDYSVHWDGPAANRIYVQNGIDYARGIADHNLSLMAWRSATIANAVANDTLYDTSCYPGMMDWSQSGLLERGLAHTGLPEDDAAFKEHRDAIVGVTELAQDLPRVLPKPRHR